ncbi:pyridoxal phosphate-dependent aminotransferase [Candidatus Babeliales bacterium]|nr:pyridoxal phosphate-dependent aminotransferase [Candidatus Babeliales bacterium]
MLEIKLSAIKQMEEFARNNPNIISLSQGGLKVDAPTGEIKDSVQKILETNKADYYGQGSGLLELREKISEVLSKKYQTNIPIDQIIVTHGCNGALTNLMLLLLTEDDEVILPEPAYPSYTNLARIARAKPIYVSCQKEDKNKISWHLPVEQIKSATTNKTKMIIFSNPSNPTSTLASKKDLLQLIAWCEEKGIYLVVDEVYENYVFDGEFQSITPFIKTSKRIIKLTSFSKDFGLSGWRVGYMVLPENLSTMAYIMQDSLFICPTVISQHAALAALNNQHIAKYFHDYVKENKNLVIKYLDPLRKKGIINFQNPSAGFYTFIKVPEKNTTELCLDMIKDISVSLVPGGTFGPTSKDFVRICFARNRSILEEGLKRLTVYWNKKYV